MKIERRDKQDVTYRERPIRVHRNHRREVETFQDWSSRSYNPSLCTVLTGKQAKHTNETSLGKRLSQPQFSIQDCLAWSCLCDQRNWMDSALGLL